jgi:hypothetical protein
LDHFAAVLAAATAYRALAHFGYNSAVSQRRRSASPVALHLPLARSNNYPQSDSSMPPLARMDNSIRSQRDCLHMH